MILQRYILPAASAVGLLFTMFTVWAGSRVPPSPPIPFQPPVSPYLHSIAGAGIIEANSENVLIGTPFSALVTDVYVMPGDRVKKGTPLFQLDIRVLEAQRDQAKATKEVAIANFDKLLAAPRPEDIPPFEARVKQAETNLADQQTRLQLFESVSDKRALSLDELNQRRFAAQLAYYQLQEAEADLDLLLSGTWIKDLEISAAEVADAAERLRVVETEIETATIRAPFDGEVLQVKIHVGEFAQPPVQEETMILFGGIDPLHMRVDIDEADAWRMREGAPSTAFVRGNSAINFPMRYVRTEPYIVPKRSFTGDTTERVDTRVLQVIYSFERRDMPIYTGQILDVFIEAPPLANGK